MAEQWTLNPQVLGSNPRGRTNFPQRGCGHCEVNDADRRIADVQFDFRSMYNRGWT